MATPFFNWSDFISLTVPKQIRFNAKYMCRSCAETWKVKNTSKLNMICKNPNCRRLVSAYKFEPIDTLIVYRCPDCETNKIKQTKCASEIYSDVPYCKICRVDMILHIKKHLWKKKRMFGEFNCRDCNHQWRSGNSWEGYGQQCLQCKAMILPFRLSPLKPSEPSSGRPPHRQELCEMCKKLGYNCRNYQPPPEEIAEIDEIPLEEELESVITTNSSTVGDDDDTPVNSDTPGDLENIEELDQMIRDMKLNGDQNEGLH